MIEHLCMFMPQANMERKLYSDNQAFRPLQLQDVPFKTPLFYTRTDAADALREIGTIAISDVLWIDEHLSQTNTYCVPKCCCQSVYCYHIQYFVVRILILKYFTNSRKRFRCEVIFDNNHTFCSSVHNVRTSTVFAHLA
jgi:hypothetical protein